MRVDTNIGSLVDGAAGSDARGLRDQVEVAERIGYDAVWSAETSHDPFLSCLLAAEYSEGIGVGTAIAVAFARSPMTTAQTANDIQALSGGRFVLGLGSQIKAHIERRFSMPWSQPAARKREYVSALHAIWTSWETGDRLSFKGDFYQHTLMTPMFSPGPNPHGRPKVMVAAVGELMTRAAAAVSDGLLVHGFTTQQYLETVTLPAVEDELNRSGRDRSDFQVCLPGFVVTGWTEEAMAEAAAAVRAQIAFYGSTPAYAAVLEQHGWGALHTELNLLSKRGGWTQMGQLIDEEMLAAFAVVGPPAEVGTEIARRYGALVDRFTFYTPYPVDDELSAILVGAIRSA